MKLRYIFSAIIILLATVQLEAQNDRAFIRMGNRQLGQGNFAKAEIAYRKAIALNSSNTQAIYNLGCALQAQQKDSAAIKQYEYAGKIEPNKMRKSKSYHNIGVICQSHQMYKEAIEAYKESLRNNPEDNETRYNYMLCKRLLKDSNKQQNDKQKNKNNQQQNKDNKQQNKDEKRQDKNQQQDKKQMSKDNAEQLLNAAIQEEKATQQRLKKMMQNPQKQNKDKNW